MDALIMLPTSSSSFLFPSRVCLLRALNIVAGGFFIAWALSFESPLWASIGWNVLFSAVNLWRIWLAILERRPQLSVEEQLIHQSVFRP